MNDVKRPDLLWQLATENTRLREHIEALNALLDKHIKALPEKLVYHITIQSLKDKKEKP